MLAGQLAEKYHIDLVSIHPGLVLGTVYYPNASAVSMQVMLPSWASHQQNHAHLQSCHQAQTDHANNNQADLCVKLAGSMNSPLRQQPRRVQLMSFRPCTPGS